VPADLGSEPPSPRLAAFLRNAGALMQQIRTESLGIYPVRIEADWVLVAL
jgi:hypothetical protein